MTTTKIPRLKDARTKDLKSVLGFMRHEAEMCQAGIEPQEEFVFRALARLVFEELQRRRRAKT